MGLSFVANVRSNAEILVFFQFQNEMSYMKYAFNAIHYQLTTS